MTPTQTTEKKSQNFVIIHKPSLPEFIFFLLQGLEQNRFTKSAAFVIV